MNRLQVIWDKIQDFLSIKGSLYVDAFALVFLVRLVAVLKGCPPLNAAEAGMWAATIASLAYGKGGPRPL